MPYIQGYDFAYTATNTGTNDVWFYAVAFTVTDPNGVDVSSQFTDVTAYPLKVPAGGSPVQVIFATYTGNSANLKGYTFDLRISWGHCATVGCDATNHPPITKTLKFADTPPNCCK